MAHWRHQKRRELQETVATSPLGVGFVATLNAKPSGVWQQFPDLVAVNPARAARKG
jgi:hypothetical protein